MLDSNRSAIGYSVLLAISAIALSGALLLAMGFLLAKSHLPPSRFHAGQPDVSKRVFSGNEFRPVIFGEGHYEGSASVITALDDASANPHAILVNKTRFNSNSYQFVRIEMDGRHAGLEFYLFWKLAGRPQQTFKQRLLSSGEEASYHLMSSSNNWDGDVVELAVGVFGDLRGGSVKLKQVSLEPFSYWSSLLSVWGEWTAFSPWKQSSINVYRGAAQEAQYYPVPVVAVWMFLSVVLVILVLCVQKLLMKNSQIGPRNWSSIVPIVLFFWLLLDALWVDKLLLQNQETRLTFSGKSTAEKKIADWDGEYYEFSQKIAASIPGNNKSLAILYASPEDLPMAQRLRFHLLPNLLTEDIAPLNTDWLGWISNGHEYFSVVFAPSTHLAGHADPLELFGLKKPENLELVTSSRIGVLYKVRREG